MFAASAVAAKHCDHSKHNKDSFHRIWSVLYATYHPRAYYHEIVVLADSALRARLVTAAVLVDILTARRGPSPNRRRVVAELLDPWAGSVLESLLRVLLLTSGLPAPRPQYLVVDGLEVVGRVDFAWPERRLIVEADGFAFHSDREAYRRDRARMNELERLGWRVLRFTYEDVVSRPGYVVGLVRACLALAA